MQQPYELRERQKDTLGNPFANEHRLFSEIDKRLRNHNAFESDLKINIVNLSKNDEAEVSAYLLLKRKKIVDINWGRLQDNVCHTGAQKLLIVGIDGEMSLGKIIDDLIAYRERCRKLRVILISKNFRSDEFEVHRIAICDATLKSPISSSRLDQVVRAVLLDY